MKSPLPDDLHQQLNDVFQAETGVESAILFGSRAKGCEHPASDIDLALTGELTDRDLARLSGMLSELPIPWMIDLCLLNAATHPPLREHIERVGIVIFQRNPRS